MTASTIDNKDITTRRHRTGAGSGIQCIQELFDDLQSCLNLFQSGREGEYEGEIYRGESNSFTSRLFWENSLVLVSSNLSERQQKSNSWGQKTCSQPPD